MYTKSLWFSQREGHIHMKKWRQGFDLAYTCMCLSRTDKNSHMLAPYLLKLMEVECTFVRIIHKFCLEFMCFN